MATGPANPIARYVREIVGAQDTDALSDGQLLERFTASREEAAFHALLRRHGPMVYGVCRRFLHDPNEADDAFQATFLVLVRRAGAIGRRESVGAWLYRVAFRIAARAKMRTNRQRQRESAFTDSPAPSENGAVSPDLRPLIDEELNRLPKKYRDPLVLRYLQEKPTETVAAELCWPLGTVKTRLAKARELLRSRLARRGVAVSAVALEASLGETTSAAVPAVLAETTAQAALLAAAGQTAGTAGAIFMSEGVIHEMLRTKLARGVFGALVLLGLVAAGAGWLLSELRADKPAAEADEPGTPPRAPVRAVVPPELVWMPNDAMGFVSIRVADLWDAALGEELRQKLSKEQLEKLNLVGNIVTNVIDTYSVVPSVLQDKPVKNWSPLEDKALGLDLPKLRRLTLLFPSALGKIEDPPILAVTTREPYQRDTIQRAVAPGAKEQKAGGKTYFASDAPNALVFVDDHTFLIFPRASAETVVPRLQPEKPASPLRGSMALAGSQPFVLALNPTPLRGYVKLAIDAANANGVPQQEPWVKTFMEALQPLAQADGISLSLATGKELKADLFLSFADRKAKDDGAKAVKLLITLAEAGLGALRQSAPAGPVKELVGGLKSAVRDATVRQEGNRLHLPLRAAVGDHTVAAAVGEAVTTGVTAARGRAQHIASINNLKQIAVAMHGFHDAHGKFPAAAIYSKDGKPLLSWRVAILPYMEQNALYKEFKLDEPWDSEHNKKLLAKMPKIFAPVTGTAAQPYATFYQVFTGGGSIFETKNPPSLAQISNANGTSNTVLLVEAGEAVPWTKPQDLPFVPGKPLPKMAEYNGSCVAAFADGHVQAFPKEWFGKNAPLLINWLNDKPIVFP